MKLSESSSLYRRLQACNEEIDVIEKTCRMLFLPQKTLAISCYNFFAVKAESKIEPDDIVLITASIDLACRVCETSRSTEKILKIVSNFYSVEIEAEILSLYIREIYATEVDVMVILDFNLEISEIYNKLERICKEKRLDTVMSRRCWIVLNDIMRTPLPLYYTIDEILATSIFINLLALEKEQSEEESYRKFSKEYCVKEVAFECIYFICNELLNNYSINDTAKV